MYPFTVMATRPLTEFLPSHESPGSSPASDTDSTVRSETSRRLNGLDPGCEHLRMIRLASDH
jgi:hypothetical protein